MGGVAGIATLVAVSALPAAATGNDDGPVGHAFAAQADVNVLGGAEVHVPALPMAHYPKGADKSVVAVNVPPLTGDLIKVNVLNGKSELGGGKLVSDASIADIHLLHDLIYVDVLKAVCTADGQGLSGYSDIVHVRIKDKSYTVDGKHPLDVDALGNQVPGGIIQIRADEEKRDGNKLTVNALHVHVGGLLAAQNVGVADIVLSQAECALPAGGVVVPPPTGPNPGGGSTPPGSSGGSGSTTTSNNGSAGAPSTSAVGPINNASNNGKLANTGVTGVVPLIIGAVVLLGAGTGALLWTRRRRAAAGSSGSEN
jgi:LPXTG-motif cell wall-anchored protein